MLVAPVQSAPRKVQFTLGRKPLCTVNSQNTAFTPVSSQVSKYWTLLPEATQKVFYIKTIPQFSHYCVWKPGIDVSKAHASSRMTGSSCSARVKRNEKSSISHSNILAGNFPEKFVSVADALASEFFPSHRHLLKSMVLYLPLSVRAATKLYSRNLHNWALQTLISPAE